MQVLPGNEMMSGEALNELRNGEVGHSTFALVTDVARKVSRSGKYRTPNGSWQWSAHDVEDLVGDFFHSVTAPASLAVGCTDADHLRSKVQTVLARLTVDRIRATPRGALRRRTERRMRMRPDVHSVVPHHWALVAFAAITHWGEGRERLDAAAALVAVDPGIEWSGERATPACTSESLDAVCDAVLNEAASPVERPLMLTVVTDRIIPDDLNHVPSAELDSDDVVEAAVEAEPSDRLVAAVEEEAARSAASAIFDMLDDNERRLLPYIDLSVRDIAAEPAVGLGKTTVAAKVAPLKAKLSAALRAAPDRALLMRCLLEARTSWLEVTGQSGGDAP